MPLLPLLIESKLFALSLGEYPQTINAISKGRRGINPALSIKLGHALGVDDEYFALLQAYYDIEKERKMLLENQTKPDLAKIRKILFWDTDINKIDWQKNKRAIIRRIFERGSDSEIKEIISFYGEEVVIGELKELPQFLPTLSMNADKYFGINLISTNDANKTT
jgi:plasmid maintenance system antidote protein VapI